VVRLLINLTLSTEGRQKIAKVAMKEVLEWLVETLSATNAQPLLAREALVLLLNLSELSEVLKFWAAHRSLLEAVLRWQNSDDQQAQGAARDALLKLVASPQARAHLDVQSQKLCSLAYANSEKITTNLHWPQTNLM